MDTKVTNGHPLTKVESQSPDGVSAVERALAVLTAFRRGDTVLSLAQLAERTGLVKSTILRLAVSLQRYKLLVQLPDSTFRLGSENLRLGAMYQQSFNIADQVLPALEELATATGETSSFYIRSGEERLCLFRFEGPNRIRMHIQPGDSRPLDKSAGARVLLHFEQAKRRAARAGDLPYFSSGATDPHAASLAAPVFGADLELLGTLIISGPVSRLTRKRADEVKGDLLGICDKVTLACGGVPLTQQVPLARLRRASNARKVT